jgi:hypothetical protein
MSAAVGETGATLGEQDLREIAAEVWAAFLPDGGLPPEPAAPAAIGSRLQASVSVTGAWRGQVLLELEEETAVAVARAMLAVDEADEVGEEDVTDAVGELVNMIGGNVKSLMSSPSTLSLPMVVAGTVTRRASHDVVELCRADLAWRGRPIRASVWEAAHTDIEG